MKNRPVIAYIDRDHVDDVLFLDGLGRHLASLQLDHKPLVLIHGSGPIAEEYLERLGTVPKRVRGALQPPSRRERVLVERGTRQQNQKIVAALTNAVVSAVSVQGSDKGLVAVEKGAIRVRSVAWIERLLAAGVVVVISALGESREDGETLEVPTGELIDVLARAFDADSLILFNRRNRPVMKHDGEDASAATVREVETSGDYNQPDVLHEVVLSDRKVYLTNVQGLDPNGEIGGTRVIPSPEG